MKFLSIASALLVSSVTARSSLFSSSSINVAPYDESLNVPGDNPLAHCQDPKDDILTLDSVDLSPNPPKAGTGLTIAAKGTLKEDIEDGASVHLQIKYGLITIIRQTASLCDYVKNVDLECPIKKGETTLSKDVELPKEIPPGKYTVLADVFTKDQKKITCLTATVEFKRGGATVVEQVLGGSYKQDM